MKKLIGIALAGVISATTLGCSSSQQSPAECLALESAVCAAEFDPTTSRPDFARCVASAAVVCGVVTPVPAPVPSQAPTAPFSTHLLEGK